jgi:hypothetical protein
MMHLVIASVDLDELNRVRDLFVMTCDSWVKPWICKCHGYCFWKVKCLVSRGQRMPTPQNG